MGHGKEELLERYEALGDENDFLAAKPLYERALAEALDARVLNEYGYLLECHGRRELRRAVEQYDDDPGSGLAAVVLDDRSGQGRRVGLQEMQDGGHQNTMKREARDTSAARSGPRRAIAPSTRIQAARWA